jgi:sialate O-acetylesterase
MINFTHTTSGENNAGYPVKYNCSFVKMIEYWRNIWNTRTNGITDPLFPFGFVQVSLL